MLRNMLVASAAVAAIAAFTLASQPVAAGSCAVLSEKAIGLKQSDAADRAQKQLTRKINRWAAKNGYKFVRKSIVSTTCTKTGAIAICKATAKVCG